MKKFGFKVLLPMLLPLCLMLGAAAPKLTAEMFGAARAGQPVLIYSMVWVPLLEISMMIAHHIIPPKTIAATPTEQQRPVEKSQQASASDHAFGTFTAREPMLLKEMRLPGTSPVDFMLSAPSALPQSPRQADRAATAILPLVCLVFLFKSLLPRSDIPL